MYHYLVWKFFWLSYTKKRAINLLFSSLPPIPCLSFFLPPPHLLFFNQTFNLFHYCLHISSFFSLPFCFSSHFLFIFFLYLHPLSSLLLNNTNLKLILFFFHLFFLYYGFSFSFFSIYSLPFYFSFSFLPSFHISHTLFNNN